MVTGAGRGLGRACALALSGAGARIIAVSRTAGELESLAEEAPGPVEAWVEDVIGDALPARIEALHRLDVLVNNAGTNQPQPFLEVTDEVLDAMLNLNVRAAFRVARSAARVMMKGGSGSIVNMSSQMGHVGSPRRTVYCMTKHGIEGLTKAMAVELGPHGIRVNTEHGVADIHRDAAHTTVPRRSEVRRVRDGHDCDEAPRYRRRSRGGGALPRIARIGHRHRDQPPGRRRVDGALVCAHLAPRDAGARRHHGRHP